MTDRVTILVEQAQDGSTDAFEELVRMHLGISFAVARSIVSSKADAEDVVQEALVRAWSRLGQCREPARFKGWLVQVVRSVALNHRSTERRRASVAGEFATEFADRNAGTDRNLARREAAETLEGLVNQLSTKQRAVLLLHGLEGYSHAEIADLLKISNGMSRRYLSDAKQLLRDRQAAEEDVT